MGSNYIKEKYLAELFRTLSVKLNTETGCLDGQRSLTEDLKERSFVHEHKWMNF